MRERESYDPIDEQSAPLTEEDYLRLSQVEPSLERGRVLKAWWEATTGRWQGELDHRKVRRILNSGIHPHCFLLTRASPRWPQDVDYGFFDRALVDGRERAVTGFVSQHSYDRLARVDPRDRRQDEVPESRRAELVDQARQDLREYVLRYFMRLAEAETVSAPHVDQGLRPREPYLQSLSWLPQPEVQSRGFGYRQLYYKRSDNGRVGKFRRPDQTKIDLRHVGPGRGYVWIVLQVRLLNACLTLRPGGDHWPSIDIPIERELSGVVSRDFIVDDGQRQGNRHGRYGVGYALLSDPTIQRWPVLQDQQLEMGFELTDFTLRDDAWIMARTVFVRNRHERFMNLPLNPFAWGLDLAHRISVGRGRPQSAGRGRPQSVGLSPILTAMKQALGRLPFGGGFDPILTYVRLANGLTGGFAARELGISKEQVEKRLLGDHVDRLFDMLEATSRTWRIVPRWSREDELPLWVSDDGDR